MDKPDALRLAEVMSLAFPGNLGIDKAAAELRRLHAERAAADGVINDLVAKVRELQEANEAFGKRQKWWNEKMFTLEQQRYALLEALKAAEPYLRHADVDYNVYVQCRAAIKAVEGEKNHGQA